MQLKDYLYREKQFKSVVSGLYDQLLARRLEFHSDLEKGQYS